MTLIATWFSEGRRAQHSPDPHYPLGIPFDASAGRPFCEVALRHPAPCVGKWTMKSVNLEGFSPSLCRFRRAGCVKAPIEFGPNEHWVFNQVNNFLPHDLVKQVLADRPAVAHRPAEMAPSVGAEAAIVMDFARGGAGCSDLFTTRDIGHRTFGACISRSLASGKSAPLGVPCVNDRALQRSTAQVLSAIYEADFLPCSFGGRPERGAHHALATLNEVIAGGKVSWVPLSRGAVGRCRRIFPIASVAAKVGLLNRQPTLSFSSGNASSCPIAAIA